MLGVLVSQACFCFGALAQVCSRQHVATLVQHARRLKTLAVTRLASAGVC
jgi:hypothetical protein